MTAHDPVISCLYWFIGGGLVLLAGSAGIGLRMTRSSLLKGSAQISGLARGCRTGVAAGGLMTVVATAGVAVRAVSLIAPHAAFPPPPPPAHIQARPEPSVPSTGLVVQLPAPLGVQPVGGQRSLSWQSLQSLSDSGSVRALHLEVVGLDGLDDPTGRWVVCVGVPEGLVVVGAEQSWSAWECHVHDHELDEGNINDRDRGRYYTYLCEFSGASAPPAYRLPLLSLSVRSHGVHRIGLGLARGAPMSTDDFRTYRSTASINCSTP